MGAAIAAGSQAEKGSCALLVIAAIKIVIQIRLWGLEKLIDITLQESVLKAIAMDNKSRTSPMRLVKAVISPALQDLGVL